MMSSNDEEATPFVSEEKRARHCKFKRLANQSSHVPPVGAKLPGAFSLQSVVSVSAVARDWGISTRRVRIMLTEGRLNGRQLENGYWEVFFPYSYTFGTRGPTLKRQQKGLEELAKKPKRLRGDDAAKFNEFMRDGRGK